MRPLPLPRALSALLRALPLSPVAPVLLSRTLVSRLRGCELWAVTYRHNGRVFTRTERVTVV